MGPVPKGVFLTKGVGRHREKLTSFELALRAANIAELQPGAGQIDFPSQLQIDLAAGRPKLSFARPDRLRGDERQRYQRAASAGGVLGRRRDSRQLRDLRLSLRASQLRRDRSESRRLCRGPRGVDARHHPRRSTSIPIPATTSARTSGGCRTKSSPRATSRSRPSAIARGLWTSVVAAAVFVTFENPR